MDGRMVLGFLEFSDEFGRFRWTWIDLVDTEIANGLVPTGCFM